MKQIVPAVLVAGATGEVGGRVVRQLLAQGVPVRAIGRHPDKLTALAALGAETVNADLRDAAAVRRACDGVHQVFTTVNNVMGHGATSPGRVDVKAHESLCAAARDAGIQRLVYLSARDMTGDSPVDFFRTKHAIEGVIRDSGVPFVFLRPGAFMETWVGMLAGGIRKNGTAILFGNGQTVANFIAITDVADMSVRVLLDDAVVNEAIEIGGPSNVSLGDIVTLLESHMGVTVKRRHIPTAALWVGGLVVRPFKEVASRFMRMGYYTATHDGAFADWSVASKRFGVNPMSIETFISSTDRR